MKMKHTIISALLALGMGTSCVESTPVLQLGGASPLGADCSIGGNDVNILRGSINLELQQGGYRAVFAITSNLTNTPIVVNDEPVGGDEDLNTLYITGMAVSYASEGLDLPGADEDNPLPLYGTLEVDGDLALNLFTSRVNDILLDTVTSGSREVLVTFKLLGKRASGDKVESNEVTFPITVFRRAACPAGYRQVLSTDPCPQAGLNGVEAECELIPPPPPPPEP